MDIAKRLRETYPATYAFTKIPHIGHEAADEIERLRAALFIAQQFCNSLTADECPDTVAIPINEALQVPNADGRCEPIGSRFEVERLRAALVHIECEPINAEYIARAALDGPNA